ncbi:MAG TPA: substrate-binding domain-containing protein, partial [Kiloniellales bacterium]|nr:substrate-binding domain-containing protein [Kiloniellales bacterium]
KTGRGVLERLASSKSDNEIGFGQITEIRLNEDLGVHLVGPLPEPIGKTTDYAVAVLADAARPEDARKLVAFMISPEGKEIFVATGVV